MRLIPSDPDIKTIVNRITDEDINLQPNFQRGEVWGEAKKVRLIDSILRDWHVPPIHVVEIKETGKQEVLDGQQRLVAIRDFVKGDIKVDGNIEPFDHDIKKLEGLSYDELPDFWRRKFEKFTIRIYSITDYLPSEPGELFYRLNQPTNLTSAEQRNAFFGPARGQVKTIVEEFAVNGLSQKEIGFSNSRMAYDDVVARLCVYLDSGKLTEKVTANVLADIYRSEIGFKSTTIDRAKGSISLFTNVVKKFNNNIKFNKATLLSWLIFLTQIQNFTISSKVSLIAEFIYSFEGARGNQNLDYYNDNALTYGLFNIFTDRSSSRVADVSSVLLRDFIIWNFFYYYSNNIYPSIDTEKFKIVTWFSESSFNKQSDLQDALLQFIDDCDWGNSL